MKAKILQKFNALPEAKRKKITEEWQKYGMGAWSKPRTTNHWPTIEDYILVHRPKIRIGSDMAKIKAIELDCFNLLFDASKRRIQLEWMRANGSVYPTLEDYLVSKLPDVGSDEEADELRQWLRFDNHPLFWPFIWDVIGHDVDQAAYEKRRKVVCEYIVERLRPRRCDSELEENLLFGDFRGTDFSNVTLFSPNFTSANLQGASFNGGRLMSSIARNANFTEVSYLKINSLINSQDLYRTKLPVADITRQVQEKECNPSDVARLEERIMWSYADALCKQYNDHDGRATIFPLLQLMQFSGFSPLDWAIDDVNFHTQFNKLYQNHEKVLDTLKQKVNAIVPSNHYWKTTNKNIDFDDWRNKDKNVNYNDWEAGSYYKDRLQTKDYKSVFKPAPCSNRAWQIYQLQTIQSDFNDRLMMVVNTLTKIKGEIEKERNIWDSELLKKINEVLAGGVNFDSLSTSDVIKNSSR